MIDEKLRAQLGTGARPVPEDLRFRLPASAGALANDVHLVTTATAADLMASTLGRLDVRYIGLDTEFRCGQAVLDEEDDDEWQDVSLLHPISVGLAAVVMDRTSGKLVLVRYAIDVRQPEVLPGLRHVLTVPSTFVAHFFKSEYNTMRKLGLPWPRDFFCAWLAGAQLTLGHHHARYVNPDPVDEMAELGAEKHSKAARRASLSLLALTRDYGVVYRFPGDKKGMQQRYLRLPDCEALTREDAEYVTADAAAAAELYMPMRVALVEGGLDRHYHHLELPAALVLAEIEYEGVTVDPTKIKRAREAAEAAVVVYEEALATHGFTRRKLTRAEQAQPGARAPVLVSSSTERARVLGRLGLLHLFASKKTKSKLTFSRELLERHRDRHRVIDLLASHAHLTSVLRDRFFNCEYIGADGRVHPRFNPLGADSGRLSCSKPNLVGIPRFMRPIVVPDHPSYGLAELDVEAQEIFIAAAEFEDENLLDDVNDGCAYCKMAKRFAGDSIASDDQQLDDDSFRKKYASLRGRWKVITLATIYGQGDEGVAARAEVRGCPRTSWLRARWATVGHHRRLVHFILGQPLSVPGAGRLKAQFFARYHGLREGLDEAVRKLAARGYTQTVTGLRRFRGAAGPLTGWERRWAVNSIVQGGGACILKLMLPRLAAFLAKHDGRLVLPIFDAVLVQFPLDRADLIIAGVRQIMIEAMQALYPATQPRVQVNASDPSCWNKDGHGDTVETFVTRVEKEVRREHAEG